MPGTTPLEKERELNTRLLDGGVHLATSEAFYGEDYGWFRVTFTVEERVLAIALKRLANVIGADKGQDVYGIQIDKLALKN